MEPQGTQTSKTILKEKNKVGGFTFPNLIATVIKTV